MRDLTNPKLIFLKAALFLVIGFASGALLLLEAFDWRRLLLLCLTVWGFCRFYYFAFYVIEKYVDPSHRFSGLGAFVAYCFRKRGSPKK